MADSKQENVKPNENEENDEGGNEAVNPEEESKIDFKPLVELKEVSVESGEEDESVLENFKMRAKLFRFDNPTKQWKERGVGDVKFLQHKDSKKVRLLMRREKTFKVCANHFVHPVMKLDVNSSSDRSWVWTCPMDYAEEIPTEEVFAIRFANTENAALFKAMFKKAQQLNKTSSTEAKTDSKDEKELEKNLKNLTVKDEK